MIEHQNDTADTSNELDEQVFGELLERMNVWVRKHVNRPALFLATAAGITMLASCGQKSDPREERCLAENIFYEASIAKEPEVGERAVGFVTLARVVSGQFPKTICGVVYQPKQFSWTLIASEKRPKFKGLKAEQAKKIAAALYPAYASKEGVRKLATELGLTFDTHYYKRADNLGVSSRGERFFKKLQSVGQPQGSAHEFYRDQRPRIPKPKKT